MRKSLACSFVLLWPVFVFAEVFQWNNVHPKMKQWAEISGVSFVFAALYLQDIYVGQSAQSTKMINDSCVLVWLLLLEGKRCGSVRLLQFHLFFLIIWQTFTLLLSDKSNLSFLFLTAFILCFRGKVV